MVTRRCPCGYETRAGFRAGKQPEAPIEKPVITPVFSNSASESETARWRSELERKFEPAREKMAETEDAQLIDDLFRPQITGLRQVPKRGSASEESEVSSVDTDVVTASEEDINAGDFALPRRPSQQTLSLEPLAAVVGKSTARPERESKPAVSKEILFSRVLAGILDLIVPVATAVLFVFAACWFLKLDFFSPSATYSWLLLALGFYLFNSLYFFWAAGRTPGMAATDLQLSADDSEEPPFSTVVIRVVLFLPVVATVVGLILALFDSECRALHDRLSKTKVAAG